MNKFSCGAAASLTSFNHAFTNMVIFVYAICFLANPVYADIVPAGETYIMGYAAFTNTNDMDVSVDGTNTKLTVSGGTLTFSTAPSSSSDLPVTAGLAARYDAANPASVQIDGSGNVTAWLDSSGNNNNATIATGTSAQGELKPVKISETGMSGNTTLDFDNSGNSYFNLDSRITGVRSVFWVLKDDVSPERAFLLGDSEAFQFHRGGYGYLWDGGWCDARIGVTTVDGLVVDGTQTVLNKEWQIVSVVTDNGLQANSIAGDRNNAYQPRSWTGEMGEILIYTQPLTDAEVYDVNCYLMNKWDLPSFSANSTSIDVTEDSAIIVGEKTTVSLGSLSIADGKTLTINIPDNKTTLWNGAISANGNANLKIVGNGAMSISSNLALGNNGSIVVDGADVTINNPGNTIFGYSGADIYINNGGSVTVSCPNGSDRFDIVSPTTITFGNSGGGSFNTGNMNGNNVTVNFVSFAEITFASTGGETNYITGSNGINLDSYNLTFNVARGTDPNGNDLVVSARLWNRQGIVKNGDGTMVISRANEYSGGTTINAGKLKVASGGTLGSGAIENRSIIEFAPADNEIMSIGQYVWNSVETAKTIKSGNGILATTNWMNGNVEIQEGTLRLDNEFGANKRFDGQVTIAPGATLLCNYHDSLGYGNGLNSRINIYGTMDNAAGNETLTNTDLYLYGGTASSSGGGTFDIYDSPVAKFYSFPLEGATETAPTVSTISSDIRLRTTGTLEIDTAANSQLNITGNIYNGDENVCPIVKNGVGTLVLSGANSYVHGTTINAGKLLVASGGSLGTGAIENRSIVEFAPAEGETMTIGQYVWNAVETAKTIKSGEGILATTNWMNGNVEIQEGTLRLDNEFGQNKRFDGRVTIAPGATLLCNYHDSLGYGDGINIRLDIYGTMDNAAGNETLTNTDLYLYGGTASSSGGGTFDIYSAPVAKFYSFPLEGATETAPTVSTISSDIRLRTNGTLEIDTAANSLLNMTGIISDGGDNVACPIVKNGAGTLALSGANTYTDGTTINAGVVKLTDNAMNTNGPIAIGANGTLEYNLTQGTKTLTFDNDNKKITGSGQITKTGEGTLQFYAENPNMVTADGFVVSSGRLDYKGFFEGDIEVLNGAILSPGNSTGTLNVTGGVAINGGIALFEFDSFASGQYDVLNILGDSNSFSAGNSMIELYFNSQDDAQAWADSLDNNSDGYKLVSDDGFAAGDYTQLLANYTDLFGLTGKSDGLYLVASSSPEPGSGVPEPSTWALLILGAAGLMFWRKRK